MRKLVTLHLTYKYLVDPYEPRFTDEKLTKDWRRWAEEHLDVEPGDIVIIHASVRDPDDEEWENEGGTTLDRPVTK